MDERLIIEPEEHAALERAEGFLDQMAEDADNLDQPDGARIMRQAAVEVRKVIGRLDRNDDGTYTLRGK